MPQYQLSAGGHTPGGDVDQIPLQYLCPRLAGHDGHRGTFSQKDTFAFVQPIFIAVRIGGITVRSLFGLGFGADSNGFQQLCEPLLRKASGDQRVVGGAGSSQGGGTAAYCQTKGQQYCKKLLSHKLLYFRIAVLSACSSRRSDK